MSEILIREALPVDAARLSEFMRMSFLAAYSDSSEAANIAAHVQRSYQAALQAAEIANPDMRTLIMEADGVFIGYAQLRLTAAVPVELGSVRAIELGRFYLAPDRKGDGSAQRLMQAAQRVALEHAAEKLWLLVWQQAPRPRRFYEKSGFRVVAARTFMIGDDAQSDWLMSADLPG